MQKSIKIKVINYKNEQYRDNRLFVCNLTLSKRQHVQVKNGMMKNTGKKDFKWSLVTYRNTIHLPITRVDNFKDKMEAIKYLQKIEPETPLISHHGRRLRIPHQEDAWLYWRKWLKKNNLFSALSTKQHCPFWLNPKGYRYGDNYLKEFIKVDAPSGQIPLFNDSNYN